MDETNEVRPSVELKTITLKVDVWRELVQIKLDNNFKSFSALIGKLIEGLDAKD